MKILYRLRHDERYSGHLIHFLCAYFLVLFNYPLVRASSTTMFIDEFGAKSSPLAWLITVVVLTLSIFVFNLYQAKHTVQKVFGWVSFLSALIFGLSTLGFFSQVKFASYYSFIWKEIYIVLQVHLLLAYANNLFRKEDFKSVVGPIGAIGSLGGVLGGLLTTYLGKKFGTEAVSWLSIVFVFLPSLFFKHSLILKNDGHETNSSPLRSLNNPAVKSYVFHIALVIMVTQFIINIADFKFNLLFEKTITISNERTAYLGNIYTWTNGISLILQFLFLPYLLPKISQRLFHLFIPLSYLVLLIGLIFNGAYSLGFIALFYVYLKASDYSLFSAGKELLYQPLLPEQKYGAKYLTDMLVYRVSKALVAVMLIYLQTSQVLNIIMVILLITWAILVMRIFVYQRKIPA
jgi:ATP:ADP antiporter, AAA family